MRNEKNRSLTLYVCQAGIIGALYAAITLLIAPIGSGVIQCRISEAMCVLPMFTPAAIPGLAIGCLVANLVTGCLWQDVIFGTLATLIGACGARLLRRVPYLVPLPTVLANTLIVPFVLAYAYRVGEGVPFLMLTIGLGELVSAYALGILLWLALHRHADRIFR